MAELLRQTMAGFLKQLAEIFRQLPADLLDAHTAATPTPVKTAAAAPRKTARR
jgi:LysR family hydrogen peroxide-inducible transcriptional activator